MNNKIANQKKNFLLLLIAMNFFTMANAQQQTGNLSAFSGSGALDTYTVSCADAATDHLKVAIRDETAAGALMNVLAVKKPMHQHAAVATDPIGGDGVFSAVAMAPGGAGDYLVYISQTAAASQNYSLSFDCADSNDVVLPGQIVQQQNN